MDPAATAASWAPFPAWALQPKKETGAKSFLAKHEAADGRGVVIAIFDSGVDPGAGGLSLTSDGKRKILARIDASGSGDVDTSQFGKVTVNADGESSVQGLSGRELRLPREWRNPTGKFRVGIKKAFDLYPRMLRERIVKERLEQQWEPAQKRHLAEATKKVQDFEDANKDKNKDAVSFLEKLQKESLDAEVEVINQLDKKFREPNFDVGPVYDVLLYHNGDSWIAVIDTTEKGDLSSALCLRPFEASGDFGPLSDADRLNVSVNVYDDGDTLQIVSMCSSHGTHVASIAAANFPDDPDKNGLAPGAQIVSVTIGDSRLSSMETGTALARAMIYIMQYKVDVINMSYGEHSHWSNTGRIGDLMSEVMNKHGIVWVASAGNDGPALCTVGTPPDISTNSVIGVGAYVSPEMMTALYSAREKLPGTPYTWTSRGPTIDGDRGVAVCAPGGAITSVPHFTLRGTQLMNGTSMASPHVCGAVALLLSGLRQQNIPWSPFSVKRALQASAKPLTQLCHYAQGHGLLQIEGAFAHLLKHHASVDRDVRFVVSCSSGGGNGAKGIHLRDDAAQQAAEIPVKIEPVFLDVDNRKADDKIDFNMRLALDCPATWVKCPEHLDLMYVIRHFLIWVDPTGLAPGVHTTYIQAYDVQQPERGSIFEVPITVVRVEPLTCQPRPHVDYRNVVFQPGTIRRHFLPVPPDATWAVVNVRSNDATNSGKFVLHTVQIWPKTVVKTYEHHKMFTLSENGEFVHGIKVKGGTTLEVCLAKWWANIGMLDTSYTVTFFGLQPDCAVGGEITMHGGEGVLRVDIASRLHSEEASPDIKLKSSVQVLRPTESKVVAMGERDRFPPTHQVYELQLTYGLSVAKQTEVMPNIPLLSDVLYESEFESQLWMLYDANKQLICSGDAYPSKWATKVEKGDYVVKAHVRSERRDVLEKMTDLTMLVSQKLASPVSPDIYASFAQASTCGKKSNSFTVHKGRTVPVYIAPLANDKFAKNASLGQYLSGTITFAKDELGKKSDSYAFKYILPEGMKKEKNKNSDGNGKKSGSKVDEFKDALRDLKISWIAKLDPMNEGKELFGELRSELSGTSLLQACAARMTALETTAAAAAAAPAPPPDGAEEHKADPADMNEVAGVVLETIDVKELLAFFGTKHDARADAADIKKDMDKQKAIYVETVARKGVQAVAAGNADPAGTRWLCEALKFTDATDAKVALFAASHAEALGLFGRALKIVLKQLEEKASIDLEKKAADLYERVGWTHALDMSRSGLPARYPQAYQPF